MDLSEASLEQAIIDIEKYKEDRGKLLAIKPTYVTYPMAKVWTSEPMSDEDYEVCAIKRSKVLAKSMMETKDKIASRVFDTAFKVKPIYHCKIDDRVDTQEEAEIYVDVLREALIHLQATHKTDVRCYPGYADYRSVDGKWRVVATFSII